MAWLILFVGACWKSAVGTAYAVWTGIGTVGTVLLGIALFGESTDLPRLACIAMIAGGIVGLKLLTP